MNLHLDLRARMARAWQRCRDIATRSSFGIPIVLRYILSRESDDQTFIIARAKGNINQVRKGDSPAIAHATGNSYVVIAMCRDIAEYTISDVRDQEQQNKALFFAKEILSRSAGDGGQQ
jgi:hypothetical protein